jgi:hypothetical protein
MKPTALTAMRFQPRHGWVNRTLRIDLSDMTARAALSVKGLESRDPIVELLCQNKKR